jgi:hypothetical protein
MTTSGEAMPVTKIVPYDAELAALDQLSPATHPARNAVYFRRIVAARKKIEDQERELRAAVEAARAAGDSWAIIGSALNTTRQGAYQRYGRRPVAKSRRAGPSTSSIKPITKKAASAKKSVGATAAGSGAAPAKVAATGKVSPAKPTPTKRHKTSTAAKASTT